MVDWEVTIEGEPVTEIFDVQYHTGKTDSLGKAVIVCGNNSNNRTIGSTSNNGINGSSGKEMKIFKNGDLSFRGYVTGKPTKAGANKTEIEIQAIDKRMELKHQQVNRVFYETDTGEIIRKILNERLSPLTFGSDLGVFIHRGEDASSWDTNIPRKSTGGIVSLALERQGGDFMFFGWPEGSGEQEVYEATYNNVPDTATVGDGQVDTFYTRLAVNNNGGIFSAEVDLRDDFGNNYIWELELPESGFEQYELKAENAVSEANIGNPVNQDQTLEYRFSIDGSLSGGRGAAIDFASCIPYRTDNRETDITGGGVVDTGNVITRRVERSAFETIQDFATEADFISYVDLNDVLHFENSGQSLGREITFDNTPVIEAEFDRDYQEITNKVTVQGDDGIRVTVPQPNSIDFYGVSSREKPIIDKSIQTEAEAERRGRGFLSKNAFDDEAFTFKIADSDYESLSVGDDVFINWPPEDILNTYQVSAVNSDKDGIVTVSLTKRGTL